jgi:hypothetical protein
MLSEHFVSTTSPQNKENVVTYKAYFEGIKAKARVSCVTMGWRRAVRLEVGVMLMVPYSLLWLSLSNLWSALVSAHKKWYIGGRINY